ncbi:MAG: metallophosphoesterase [Candidatus Krumholzibacteriia bacterium]
MPGKVRIAALADIHYGQGSREVKRGLLEAAAAAADVLLVCGDMTAYGTPAEAELMAADLREVVRIPAVGVLGNHDFESGEAPVVREILGGAGLRILDGESIRVLDVGFAGVAGFGGGFGRYVLSAWGESLIKQFVQAAVDEVLKLEQALSTLDDGPRVVLLHYAPVPDTVEGEPRELYPFLGTTRLEEPLNRHEVAAVFHGHAHHGSPEGRTARGVPVYNVSVPVLAAARPGEETFRVVEVTTP